MGVCFPPFPFFILSFFVVVVGGMWFEGRVAQNAPKTRYGASVAEIDDKRVIIHGGRNVNEHHDDYWLLYHETVSWTQVEVTTKKNPPCVSFGTSVCVENKIYHFGGLKENGKCEGDMWCADISGLMSSDIRKTIGWEIMKSSKKAPSSRYGHTCTRAGHKLVFFGGCKNGEFHNDIHYFDTKTNTWSKPSCKGIIPEGRCYHTATLIENNLYIFGGLGKNKIYSDVCMFDVEKDAWTKIMLPGTPKARFGHTASACGNSIIMWGGRTLPPEDQSGDGDLVDSFASGIPVLDTEKRGWVAPLKGIVQDDDVAHHSAVALSKDKVMFLFGLKLVIKKFRPSLEVVNNHRLLYNLETVSLQYSAGGESSNNKLKRNASKRKSQHFLFREKRKSANMSGGNEIRSSSPPSSSRKSSEHDRKKLKESEERKKKEKKKEKSESGGSIGMPYNIHHLTHVDTDFNWKGGKDVFEVQEKLGKGAFATVYKGVHHESGFVVAIKDIEDIDDDEELKKEIDILKACKHPNIVCYYGTCDSQDSLWILMDYCGMGSVRDMIEAREKVLQDEEIQYILQKSLKGLSYLHLKGIIHRDIKAANILMTKDGEIKLADFGVSEQLTGAISQADEVAGSPHWMAPEVVLEKDYDARCDIWSMGITAIEMAEGLPPKAKMNPIMAMKSVPKDPPPTLREPSQHKPEFVEFLKRSLMKDPAERPNAIETLMDPFVNQILTHEVLKNTVTDMLKIKKAKQQEKERKRELKREAEEKRKEEQKKKELEKQRMQKQASPCLPPRSPRPPPLPTLPPSPSRPSSPQGVRTPGRPHPPTRNTSAASMLPPPSPSSSSLSIAPPPHIARSDGATGSFSSPAAGRGGGGRGGARAVTMYQSVDMGGLGGGGRGHFGTFVAKGDDEGDQFGTFVAKKGGVDDDADQFGTFVAKKGGDEDEDQFGTFVAKRGGDDDGDQYGTFVAKKGDDDDGDQYGTFVAKKGSVSDYSSDQFGTFVAKGDDENEDQFGTFVAKEVSTESDGDQFGTFVMKKGGEEEEEGGDDESSEEECNFGTFVFKADDPASFATFRVKKGEKQEDEKQEVQSPGPIQNSFLPPPPPPLPPIKNLPQMGVSDRSNWPEMQEGFEIDEAKVLIGELRSEIEKLKDRLRIEMAKNAMLENSASN